MQTVRIQTFIPDPPQHPPGHNLFPLTTLPIHHKTPLPTRFTLEMPPSPFHNLSHSLAPTKRRIRPQRAILVARTLEFMLKSPEQPVNLGVDASVYDGIEVAVGMFEGERVWVGEVGGYVHVEFGGEGC
ncbi:uncharacterized protein BHQ10_003837 [Talaromyces amestolkiae]|uniref:Uncharacterized protein n=1 Tax=Talaromyces amestolkiae TaxID=1196081 RepID=A0A364KW87_TALAM|nr:uncharacterized protein BHQ10_003837 [Talaromyces amestolkiae]RAO67825.1 hypothetical protein BHQ10_003837 [Talaromyces amestolkiae]